MKKSILSAVFVLLYAVFSWSQVKLACIGNSITEAGGSTASYFTRLQTLLGSGYKLENDGVSSTTMLKNGDIPYWTKGKLSNVFAFQPNIITIKLGTNDTKPQNWDKHYSEFRQDYEAMIDTLNTISTKPKIFLVLPTPTWKNKFGISDTALQKMIPIIKAIAAKRGLSVIDVNTPLKKFSSYFADGVHPQAAAADTIANVFYRTIINAPSSFRFVARSYTTPGSGKGNTKFFTLAGVPAAIVYPTLDPGSSYSVNVFDMKGALCGRAVVLGSAEVKSFMQNPGRKSAGISIVKFNRVLR